MDTAVYVGSHPDVIAKAAESVISVLKEAGTEGAKIAACNCLAELSRAPHNTTIQNCTFYGGKPALKKGKKK